MSFQRTTVLGLLIVAVLAATHIASRAADERPAADSVTAQPTATSQAAVSSKTADSAPAEKKLNVKWPLITLGVGIALVLGLIILFKVNAFLALITAAIAVSLMAEGDLALKITRVAEAFGSSAGKIGIVIATAAVIGTCMLDSGAADRIVRAFLRVLGEKHSPVALMGSGFVLAVPVFFDTVFYLLVPLARSLHRKTGKEYLRYILAIAAGGAITHTLVPPTPGPLVMATQLGVDVGVMIMVGLMVAVPGAVAGLVFAGFLEKRMPTPMRKIGSEPEPKPLDDSQLPSLFVALLPVLLPVILISANTILETSAKNAVKPELIQRGIVKPTDAELTTAIRAPDKIESEKARKLARAANVANVFGNANFALLLSTVVAMGMLFKQRGLSRVEMAQVVETSLMSGGVIILITAGGGAFGEMLKVAQVGDAVKSLFVVQGGSGLMLLVLGFGVAAVLKVAQGSSTVAMITGSAMLAGIASPETLGFHPVYLATAIGGGSLVGSWMNDSGFWIFAKMGGLTEVEALKSWTVLLIVLGLTSFVVTLVLSQVLPLV
jgi:GntP family gluconate:H+ symporter